MLRGSYCVVNQSIPDVGDGVPGLTSFALALAFIWEASYVGLNRRLKPNSAAYSKY